MRALSKLPQTGIGVAPDRAEEVCRVSNPLPDLRRKEVAALRIAPDRLEQIAEAAELKLASSLVALVHGRVLR
jgi:hypothetical protein